MLIGALAALVSIRVSAEGADGILECKAKVPNRTSVALAKKRNIGPWKMQQHGKCHMASDERTDSTLIMIYGWLLLIRIRKYHALQLHRKGT